MGKIGDRQETGGAGNVRWQFRSAARVFAGTLRHGQQPKYSHYDTRRSRHSDQKSQFRFAHLSSPLDPKKSGTTNQPLPEEKRTGIAGIERLQGVPKTYRQSGPDQDYRDLIKERRSGGEPLRKTLDALG